LVGGIIDVGGAGRKEGLRMRWRGKGSSKQHERKHDGLRRRAILTGRQRLADARHTRLVCS
jgi:hypothetical protein